MTTPTTLAPPTAKPAKPPPWRLRLDVVARSIAAIFLGYLFAALSTAVLARFLPGPRAEASMAATLLSFAVYAGVAVWAFAHLLIVGSAQAPGGKPLDQGLVEAAVMVAQGELQLPRVEGFTLSDVEVVEGGLRVGLVGNDVAVSRFR